VIRRRAAAVTLLAALAAVSAASAYVQEDLVDRGSPDVGLSQAGVFVLRLEQDGSFRIVDGTDLAALRDAMARWTDVPTSDAVISEGTPFDLPSPIDASAGLGTPGNRLVFAETDVNNRIGSAIAVSYFTFGADGRITDCDIVMNERLYTFSTTSPADPNQILGNLTFDIGETATHEMGHCLGLDHSAVAGAFSPVTGLQVSGFSTGDFTWQATLYPYASGTIQGRSLSSDDIAGISFIYPNATLAATTGTISGRVLDGASFAPVRGAHVVAVSSAAPDVPVVGVISDVQAGGAGGEFNLYGLAPGDYYLRLEPLVGTSNPFNVANTFFAGFTTSFPPEFWDGATESGFDVPSARAAITVTAGQTAGNIVFFTNVGAPDPGEPNDTRAAATAAACGSTRNGSIVPQNDVDWYAVTVADATALTVDVSASRLGSTLDAVAAVYDSGGDLLGSDDNAVALDPVLTVDLPAPGIYYVGVASYNDAAIAGSGGLTAGSYSLTLSCSVPKVPAGTCPGRVLYAGTPVDGSLVAISDRDHSLRYDGETTMSPVEGGGQGQVAARRDGGVALGMQGGTTLVFWDDNGDFLADRSASFAPGFSDGGAVATMRRGGAEILFTGDQTGGGTVIETVDTNGDFIPERTTVFTAAPESVSALAVDDAGTVYVLDALANGGMAAILAYRDLDGDGVADTGWVFYAPAPSYAMIAARAPGEVFASDIFLGQIDRIRDLDGDGVADVAAPYATGLALDVFYGLAFDRDDVLYSVDGGAGITALPDADHDGAADAHLAFAPLSTGYGGLAFGVSPPEQVSPPRSAAPVTVAPIASGLRLTWEDQGAGTPAYNLYQGTLAAGWPPLPLLCHVTGAPDGAGSRSIDITPVPAGGVYFVVTASDACGEGSFGRRADGVLRPAPLAACGATQ
jgi:hypothetical protein